MSGRCRSPASSRNLLSSGDSSTRSTSPPQAPASSAANLANERRRDQSHPLRHDARLGRRAHRGHRPRRRLAAQSGSRQERHGLRSAPPVHRR
jgi:hypothetical protein